MAYLDGHFSHVYLWIFMDGEVENLINPAKDTFIIIALKKVL